MENTQASPLGPKQNNASGSIGQLQASEWNDNISEAGQPLIESGQIFNITKTPYQLARAASLKGMTAMSWLEDTATASANLSNLIPMNSQTLIVFSAAFITGNIITITINNSALSPISFTTSNTVTFAAIVAAIQAAYPSATVNYDSNVYGTFYYISIYQAGTTFTVNSIVFTGTAASTPNYQVSYGNTTPDSYSEMDGCIIMFNKSIANTTTTPQINLATGQSITSGSVTNLFNTTANLMGAITVTLPGGAAVPIGTMYGLCIVRFNLALNSGQGYWELLSGNVNKIRQTSITTPININVSDTTNSLITTGMYLSANELTKGTLLRFTICGTCTEA